MTVIHNWEDRNWIRPRRKTENPFAREHGFLNELTVLYSGNLGQYHDFESVVKAAASIESSNIPRPVHLVFIRKAGKKATLQPMVEERNLDSVSFLLNQPGEVLPDSLILGIHPRRDGGMRQGALSKFYTALTS